MHQEGEWRKKENNSFLAFWMRPLHFRFVPISPKFGAGSAPLHPSRSRKRRRVWLQSPSKACLHDSKYFFLHPLILFIFLIGFWGPGIMELLLKTWFGFDISHVLYLLCCPNFSLDLKQSLAYNGNYISISHHHCFNIIIIINSLSY